MLFKSEQKYLQWGAVKGVVGNELSRVVCLIPIAGYLILFNDEIIEFASFDFIAGARPEAASPFLLDRLTKLRFVFFGSLAVLLSVLIYKTLSPPVIKEAHDDLHFAAVVRDRYSVHEIARMENLILSDGWKPRTSGFWIVHDLVRARKPVVSGFRPDARELMFGSHGAYIHFLAREYWVGMMHRFRAARLMALSLGLTGYILLGLPTLDIAQAVVRDIALTSLW